MFFLRWLSNCLVLVVAILDTAVVWSGGPLTPVGIARVRRPRRVVFSRRLRPCPRKAKYSAGAMALYSTIASARKGTGRIFTVRSEEHTSELQSRGHLVCRLLLEKKKINKPPD